MAPALSRTHRRVGRAVLALLEVTAPPCAIWLQLGTHGAGEGKEGRPQQELTRQVDCPERGALRRGPC